jgi:hypothetical protein
MGGAAPSAPEGMKESRDGSAGRGCDGAQPPRDGGGGMNGGRRSVGAGGQGREQAWIRREWL